MLQGLHCQSTLAKLPSTTYRIPITWIQFLLQTANWISFRNEANKTRLNYIKHFIIKCKNMEDIIAIVTTKCKYLYTFVYCNVYNKQ